MVGDNNDLIERLLKCEEELEYRKSDLQTWTDALEELSEIENAFATDGRIQLDGKTILDVGTDCVKPLYLALKFKPDKIIGIDENLPSIASDLKLKCRLFADTKIGLYDCSLFDEETFHKIMEKEDMQNGRFDFVLVSKTMHHLRTEKCIMKHKHREIEACCIYGFDERKIFKKLLELGTRVIVYEAFGRELKDEDKIRGRGGYFTAKELKETLVYLSGKYRVVLIRPERFIVDTETLNKVDLILRKVDIICFFVEEQDAKNSKRLIAKTER